MTRTPSPAREAAGATGTLSVIDSTDYSATDPDIGFPLFSDFHDSSYAYTAG